MNTYRLPAKVLKALAHPARLRLLNALRDGEVCVSSNRAARSASGVCLAAIDVSAPGGADCRPQGWLAHLLCIKDRRVLQVLEAVNALARIKGVAAEPRVLAKCPCPKCGVNKRRRANSHN